jgi:hypothetical protein
LVVVAAHRHRGVEGCTIVSSSNVPSGMSAPTEEPLGDGTWFTTAVFTYPDGKTATYEYRGERVKHLIVKAHPASAYDLFINKGTCLRSTRPTH